MEEEAEQKDKDKLMELSHAKSSIGFSSPWTTNGQNNFKMFDDEAKVKEAWGNKQFLATPVLIKTLFSKNTTIIEKVMPQWSRSVLEMCKKKSTSSEEANLGTNMGANEWAPIRDIVAPPTGLDVRLNTGIFARRDSARTSSRASSTV